MNWNFKTSNIVVFTALLALVGCASNGSSPLRSPSNPEIRVPRNHVEVIEANSSGDSDFSGLYNTFEIKATILNSQVRDALTARQAEYYQWDHAQTDSDRDRQLQENSSEADVFMSFSTPIRKNDNLADKKTIWRVFLEADGHRYQGTVKKDRRLLTEIQALFPYHTRWNTPYLLSFPVSMSAIESNLIKLTITGPAGSRTLEFRPVIGHKSL